MAQHAYQRRVMHPPCRRQQKPPRRDGFNLQGLEFKTKKFSRSTLQKFKSPGIPAVPLSGLNLPKLWKKGSFADEAALLDMDGEHGHFLGMNRNSVVSAFSRTTPCA
ncbi:hypothetical protein ACLBWT_00010 [Paenibacillus sp. D51F]